MLLPGLVPYKTGQGSIDIQGGGKVKTQSQPHTELAKSHRLLAIFLPFLSILTPLLLFYGEHMVYCVCEYILVVLVEVVGVLVSVLARNVEVQKFNLLTPPHFFSFQYFHFLGTLGSRLHVFVHRNEVLMVLYHYVENWPLAV